MPQSSVEPDVLNAACKKVAEACKSRGIIGYLSVDFVTFIDSKTVSNSLHFNLFYDQVFIETFISSNTVSILL